MIIKQFNGGSMANTYLIKENNKTFVRKIVENNNVKLGKDKLNEQRNWLLNINNLLPNIFPNILNYNNNGYDMEYINNITLRDYIFKYNKINYKLIDNSIDCLIKINNLHKLKNIDKNYIKKEHVNKMFKRININNTYIQKLINYDYLIINNHKYKNIKLLLNEKLDDFEPEYFNMSHGDYTLQNILTDGQNIRLIDPRGTEYNSLYYDVSKLLQSTEGKYDLLFDNNYKCIYKDNNINYQIFKYVNIFNDINNYIKLKFNSLLDNDWYKKSLFYEGSHFISMMPFRYKENLDITVLCYCIGIILLNKCLEDNNG